MSPADHYHQAEDMLTIAGEPGAVVGDPMKTIARELVRANRLAIAQVHAPLATVIEFDPDDEPLRDVSGNPIG